MSLEKDRHQKPVQAGLPNQGRGETSSPGASGESRPAAHGNERAGLDGLMEKVVEGNNAKAALKKVKANKGSPGSDGMTVEELTPHLIEHWQTTREQLLAGSYQPKPVKRQRIPKSGGGERELGIPCVLDRMIQQAILQVLQPIFDPTFSEHSHGFRPGRSAHDAVCAAQRYIQSGRTWVVDIDLEKFFDRVNHDVLMERLARKVADKRLLGLIRRYLQAPVVDGGVMVERREGTPQGGPLSPLLANVLLDEVDKDLEKRGHAFARYADDCNVYVRSARAGERVLQSLRRLYTRLRLKVNESKSAVARPWSRKFLGYSFWRAAGRVKRRVAPKAIKTMKERVRRITRRAGGRSLQDVIEELGKYLPGWRAYFQLADTPGIFRTLDGWIRRRLRALQLKQWRNSDTIYRELCARGLDRRTASWVASNGPRWWSNAMVVTKALPNSLYAKLGLPCLSP